MTSWNSSCPRDIKSNPSRCAAGRLRATRGGGGGEIGWENGPYNIDQHVWTLERKSH